MITLFKSKKIKIIVVISIISIILIYFIIRRIKNKRLETFTNEDQVCIKSNDPEKKIYNFRIDMGYPGTSGETSTITSRTGNDNYFGQDGGDISIKYRHDYIALEELGFKTKDEFLISPTGVIFDTNNDDIIVFDIYKLRRFQYRLNRSKFTIGPINELLDIRNNYNITQQNTINFNPKNIEILSEYEKKRKLLYIYLLIYCTEQVNLESLKKQLLLLFDSNHILKDNYLDENTDFKLMEIINKVNIEKEIKDNKDSQEQIKTLLEPLLIDSKDDGNFITYAQTLLGISDEIISLTLGNLRKEILNHINFFTKYRRLKDCRDNAVLDNTEEKRYKCSIKYQEDLPRYDLGEQGKGIESLNYDKEKKAPLFDNIMNPMSNSWREAKYNGIFEPIKTYRDKRVFIKDAKIKDAMFKDQSVNNIGIKGTTLIPNTDVNPLNLKNNYLFDEDILLEPFENKVVPNLTSINFNDKGKAGFYLLPDEFDAIGVKMCLYKLNETNFIFVPDVLNNRIQIFSLERGAEFEYKGQFGNLDYTSHRSLPTYQGEKVIDIYEPLKNTSIMYEPIHNMEIFENSIMKESPTRCAKTCPEDQNEMKCYSELKNKLYSQGPKEIRNNTNSSYGQNIDKYYESYHINKIESDSPSPTNNVSKPSFPLNEENINECITEFSTRRANIHHRQYEYDSDNQLLTPIKRGHFYSLYNEYVRVKNYLKRPDIKSTVYNNPFNLVDGAELCIGKYNKNCKKTKDPYDGVEGCSIAYRKYLLKNIKETNDGQKYGQLFRPKAITYDSESDLFYVADTYHHCIQCFKLNKNVGEEDEKYKEGTNLVFESADKDFNESNLYCYDKDWNYNLGYHNTPVYSLGLRQQILEKTPKERKEDLNRGSSVYPTSELPGTFNIPPSNIEDEWVKKFSEPDGQVRLYRWVSGSTKYANHSYNSNDKINYNEIGKEQEGKRLNEDYFFYTNLVKKDSTNEENEKNEEEALRSPGVGEFLYPSDLVFVKRAISPVENNDLLLVTDTGNNRVSIFKKYYMNIDTNDKYRFRFYRFLGDKNSSEERKLENPIGITVNPINGCIYVLQGNMFNHNSAGSYQSNQSIKVYTPKRVDKEGYYKYSHTIILFNISDNLGDKDPRFTKIEVDDRGIILLTDINNRRIQILREHLKSCPQSNSCSLNIVKYNSNLLNKVIFEIKYNPHQGINNIFEPFSGKYLVGYNRFRFVCERFNISTGSSEPDILLSQEYNHNYFDSSENTLKNIFILEDKYEELVKPEGYWFIENKKQKLILDLNPSNVLDVNKTKTKNQYNNTITKGIEEWQGKSMSPNTSYRYIIHLFNYHTIEQIKYNQSSEAIEIHTHPLNIPSNELQITNIVTKKENYLNIRVNYPSISQLHLETAKYNPLCIYLLRRNHNRTREGLLRYFNMFRHNMIQLLIPNESKYIYNNFSKPKFGKLYVYNITHAYSPTELTKEDLLEPSQLNQYSNSNYLIFYSAEGGNIEQNGKILPTAEMLGMDYVDDFFTLGDDPKTPHTKIKFNVKIDIRQSNKNVIMVSDIASLESNLLYYKKDRYEKDENSLQLINKYPIAQDIEGYKNNPVEYQDKGIIKNGIKIPIPLNRTLEYNVLIANQYKINPSATTLFYTTRPEKPYIKEVSKVEVIENGKKVSKIKIDWYYTQNKNLYWPVNFIILRLPVTDIGPSIPIITQKLDFTQGSPHNNDKHFNIESNLVTVKMGGKHTFEKTFALDGKRKWEVVFLKFNNKVDPGYKNIFINGKKIIWSSSNKSHIFTNSFITINVDLDGAYNEYLNQVIVKEYIEQSEEIQQGPSISDTQRFFSSVIDTEQQNLVKDKEQLKEETNALKLKYKEELNEEYNEKFIQAVEAYRQMNRIGFYFNLQDDYNGYYRSVVDNYSGNSGQLLYYLKAQSDNDLYKIFDELHDKIKIYHGEATMTIDGPNGMLRSGGKDAMIDKIRHLSFMLKEATKTENKSLGIVCKEQDLSDIFKEGGFEGAMKCLTDEKDKKMTELEDKGAPIESPEPLTTKKLNELTSNFDIEYERDFISLGAKEVSGETLQSVLEKFNFDGIWQKEGINNIVYDLERNTAKLIKEKVNSNPNNKLGNRNTILLWRKGEKDISNGPSMSSGLVTDRIKPYQVLKRGNETKQLKSFITEDDRNDIIENYSIPPTLISLSAGKHIPSTKVFNDTTKDKEHYYSIHTHYLPADLDKEYSYKIGCFQTGHNLNSTIKKQFLGIVNNGIGSELGFGEVYSDEAVMGKPVINTQVENDITNVMELETPIEPPKEDVPVIKYFEPKEGTEETMIRIVGLGLDKLDYIAIRDIKVQILKKQKRIIVENGKEVSYDEYLIKPPTLKELERECWQSYEPYKTLLWGYFEGNGKQITSSEIGPENKMYKYLVRKICPEKQMRKYAPS